jgi:response regulator RpfG family c-di-GMP phosphodiesterase
MVLTSVLSKPVILCLKGDEKKLDLKWIRENHKEADIICASHPVNALEVLTNRQVALLIIDPDIKDMDGIEFLSRARKLSPDTVRVLMNCSHDPDLIVKAIKEGKVWKCLTSPWKPEKMGTAIEEGMAYWQ